MVIGANYWIDEYFRDKENYKKNIWRVEWRVLDSFVPSLLLTHFTKENSTLEWSGISTECLYTKIWYWIWIKYQLRSEIRILKESRRWEKINNSQIHRMHRCHYLKKTFQKTEWSLNIKKKSSNSLIWHDIILRYNWFK